MPVFRFFNNGELLLIEVIEANSDGVPVKVYETYLTRPEAQKLGRQMVFEANTKLKEPNDKSKVQESKPLPDETSTL